MFTEHCLSRLLFMLGPHNHIYFSEFELMQNGNHNLTKIYSQYLYFIPNKITLYKLDS